MGIRSIFVALLGVAVAGGSAYAAREYLNAQVVAQNTKAASGAKITRLVVATQDIPFGVAITPQMLRYQKWPEAALPPGSFQKVSELARASGQPRRARYPMAAGLPILASEVSHFGEKVTLVQSLTGNTRAMAIKVDAVTAVGGFVTPGDHVDIILTQGHGVDLRSVTIMQDIRVLGVDQQSNQRSNKVIVARTVTVEVTPNQSQKLALAQKAGTLSLSLRPLTGVVDKKMDYVSVADLMRNNSPTPPTANKTSVTVRRGSKVQVVDVSN